MFFSEKNMKEAWRRANGKCEGMVVSEGRKTTCGRQLEWEDLCLGPGNQCKRLSSGKCWTATPRLVIKGTPLDVPSNCQILCHDCHSKSSGSVLIL